MRRAQARPERARKWWTRIRPADARGHNEERKLRHVSWPDYMHYLYLLAVEQRRS